MVSVRGRVSEEGEGGFGETSVAGPGLLPVTEEFSDASPPGARQTALGFGRQPESPGVFCGHRAAASPPEFAITTESAIRRQSDSVSGVPTWE